MIVVGENTMKIRSICNGPRIKIGDNATEARFLLGGRFCLNLRHEFLWDSKIIPPGQKPPVWIVDQSGTSLNVFFFNGYKIRIRPRDQPVIVQPEPNHMASPDTPADFRDEDLYR
jgi:hypothetical protein